MLPASRIEQAQPHDTLVRIGVCPIDDSGQYVESAGCRDGRSTSNSCPVVLRHSAHGEALPEASPDVVAFQIRVQLARAAGLRSCGELGGREAARGCELAHAAGEIAQMQAQLIERKAEREDALQRFIRQRTGDAFAA